MSQNLEKKSNNKGIAIIKALILLILMGIFSVNVYKNVKLTRETIDKRNELISENNLSDEDKAVVDEWNKVLKNRYFNYGMCLVWYVIVFMCVAKVGPAQKVYKHISKEDAAIIAAELNKKYHDEGIFIEKNEDDDEEEAELLPETLEIPKLVSAVLKDNMIEFTWEGVPDADGYSVYRKTESSNWKRIGRTTSDTTVYQDFALEANTRYIYSVKAFLVSEDRRIVSRKDTLGLDVVSGKGNLPEIPEIFAINENGKHGIGWKAVKGAKAYRVFMTKSGKRWKQVARITAAEEFKYFVEDNMAGEPYKYAVSAATAVNKHPVVGEHDKVGITV